MLVFLRDSAVHLIANQNTPPWAHTTITTSPCHGEFWRTAQCENFSYQQTGILRQDNQSRTNTTVWYERNKKQNGAIAGSFSYLTQWRCWNSTRVFYCGGGYLNHNWPPASTATCVSLSTTLCKNEMQINSDYLSQSFSVTINSPHHHHYPLHPPIVICPTSLWRGEHPRSGAQLHAPPCSLIR